MLVKLVLIIMVVGATASGLLVIRQRRIDTFHEISLIHQRLLMHERTLWELREQIAERCRPSQVRGVMHQIAGQWTPIPALPNLSGYAEMRVAQGSIKQTPATR